MRKYRMKEEAFLVKTPGRICLFGEHSDYLGLDVIAAAIDLTIDIEASPRDDNQVHIDYLDLKEHDSFPIGHEIPYRNNRDYIRSAFNVMGRRCIEPEHGWNLRVTGKIPIAAGLSSSSALTVGTIMAIARMAQKEMAPEDMAIAAFESEVLEFDESGGTMDHYTTALGGVIHINTNNRRVTRLPAKVGAIVIGDSGEKKTDTVGDLEFIRTTVEREYKLIAQEIPSFDRRTTPISAVSKLSRQRPNKERSMAEATLRNRDLTNRALKLLESEEPYEYALGAMLREHHEILRDGLDRSTPKIERMIEAAYDAGALGCKINGSGRGGTMMAYTAGSEREVASAIQEVGGTAYIVMVSRGTNLNPI
ncbi:GHMP kinase [Candidatus Thorarchaeota archaeon]|nr:MAG: GHMP kinase [Candidatus Thorarchaeota archaeon]